MHQFYISLFIATLPFSLCLLSLIISDFLSVPPFTPLSLSFSLLSLSLFFSLSLSLPYLLISLLLMFKSFPQQICYFFLSLFLFSTLSSSLIFSSCLSLSPFLHLSLSPFSMFFSLLTVFCLCPPPPPPLSLSLQSFPLSISKSPLTVRCSLSSHLPSPPPPFYPFHPYLSFSLSPSL